MKMPPGIFFMRFVFLEAQQTSVFEVAECCGIAITERSLLIGLLFNDTHGCSPVQILDLFILTIFFRINGLLSAQSFICGHQASLNLSDVVLVPVLGEDCPAAGLRAGRSVTDMCLTSAVDDGQEMQLNHIPAIHESTLSRSRSVVCVMSIYIIFAGRNKFESIISEDAFQSQSSEQMFPAITHQPVSASAESFRVIQLEKSLILEKELYPCIMFAIVNSPNTPKIKPLTSFTGLLCLLKPV